MPTHRLSSGGRAVIRRIGVNLESSRHRLRGRANSADEVLRSALPPGTSLKPFLRSFGTRDTARFFFAADEAADIVNHLQREVPGWAEQTIADADAICTRTVRLLGADRLDLAAFVNSHGVESRIPWHWDVLSEYRWDERTYHKKIAIPYDRADIKVPWELSRCQHLPSAGIAYLVTGDSRYATEIITEIEDWIEGNPPGYGVNWACTMDVAIRAVNWLWAYNLIASSPSLGDDFLMKFLASLISHARHITRNIERYASGITTNHTLANYVGLLYLGLSLPELREAERWTADGMSGIEDCMKLQVLPDGADFENSIAYHRLVLEMFLGSHILAERNGRSFSADFRSSLEQMLEFVCQYTQPNGHAPLIGDSDDGRLQILSNYFDWPPEDHRYLLRTGGILFDRGDFIAVAEGAPGAEEEATWLLGVPAGTPPPSVEASPITSRAFCASGRYVMRDRNNYALVCADEVGTGGLGNHKHNDISSFHLSVDGAEIVVDPGSFVYTRDLTWRNHFRSTRFHNTLTVDGLEQNEIGGPFWLKKDALVNVAEWHSDAELDSLEIWHTGYERLVAPVSHRRRVRFTKEPFSFVVVDSLHGRGTHTVESLIHLSPHGSLAASTETGFLDSDPSGLAGMRSMRAVDATLEPRLEAVRNFVIDQVTVAIVPLSWPEATIEPGWVAPRYGQRVPAPVLRFTDSIECEKSVGYMILPVGRRDRP